MSRSLVILAGPSGSGKSRLAALTGHPVLRLDEFYRDADYPGLPRTLGIVDWDDIASWDLEGALHAARELIDTGRTQLPAYDISASKRVGLHWLSVGDDTIIAEGIFAPDLLPRCSQAGLAVTGIWLDRPRLLTFLLRLRRDLAEHRKPPWILLRRGFALMRAEPALRRRAISLGCQALSMRAARHLLDQR